MIPGGIAGGGGVPTLAEISVDIKENTVSLGGGGRHGRRQGECGAGMGGVVCVGGDVGSSTFGARVRMFIYQYIPFWAAEQSYVVPEH